jgi:hypothetical protein
MSYSVHIILGWCQIDRLWHWLSYGQNADALQAIAAIIGVVALGCYVLDTRRIRKATLAQSEASRRPFFRTSAETLESRNLNEKFMAINVGEGHALNVTGNFVDRPLPRSVEVGACCKEATAVVTLVDSEQTLRNIRESGLLLEYEDTAGKRYWTEIRFGSEGQERIAVGEGGSKRAKRPKSRF